MASGPRLLTIPFIDLPTRRALRCMFLVFGLSTGTAAHATVAVLQPAREAAATQPLELTLLYTDDDSKPLTVDVPKQLTVRLTNGDLPPAPLALARDRRRPTACGSRRDSIGVCAIQRRGRTRRAARSRSILWASMPRRCSSR